MAFLHEHIILPLSDLATGQHVHRDLRRLRRAERWGDEEMRQFQIERLRAVVDYAARHVPYYRDWFASQPFRPQDIHSLSDLRLLPVVDKSLMRREGIDRFTAEGFPIKHRRSSRSSGSTGEPFSFYVSDEAASVNTAAKLRTWQQAGYHMGDRYMKIANGARHGRLKSLQDSVNRCTYVPFYSMDDSTLQNILELVDMTRPTIIRSYPAPLYLLARYRISHPVYRHQPRHIMTTGSTLPAAYRDEIEHAFGCDIIDSYSCEGTPNTYETTAHDGYRICDYYGIIEVIDEAGRPITDGIGRVVSTDLWNLAHPFIRYDTQDLVEVAGGQIQRIMGRECEAIIQSNGNMYTVHNFSHFFIFDVSNSVDNYQVVHHSGGIPFRLVVNAQYTPAIEQYIIDHWHSLLGVPVSIEIVDNIPLMHNNKRLTIVKEP